jgi:hypothetical protein
VPLRAGCRSPESDCRNLPVTAAAVSVVASAPPMGAPLSWIEWSVVVVVIDSDDGQKALVGDGGPAVYKATVRLLIRRAIGSLNQGHYEPALAMFASDADLTFPGDNVLARQHRTPQGGRAPFPTHRGRDEIEAFLRRYVEQGNQMEIEDILVNGPPGTPERQSARTYGSRIRPATRSTPTG